MVVRPDRATSAAASLLACAALALTALGAEPVQPASERAAALRARFDAASDEIAASPFGRPLVLHSTQSGDALSGEILAIVEFPFGVVRASLADARNWCEILMLHPNVERCAVGRGERGASIRVDVGRARLPVAFAFDEVAAAGDYLHVGLVAAQGPFGTTDYRIDVDATPLDDARTEVRFAFSQAYGTRARLAMQAYLATFGRDKVGFTVAGRAEDGTPRRVRGLRGALERNAMRYYLAMEAYLATLAVPPPGRRDARLAAWFAYTQRYPLQLHEDDAYLAAKREQLARLAS